MKTLTTLVMILCLGVNSFGFNSEVKDELGDEWVFYCVELAEDDEEIDLCWLEYTEVQNAND